MHARRLPIIASVHIFSPPKFAKVLAEPILYADRVMKIIKSMVIIRCWLSTLRKIAQNVEHQHFLKNYTNYLVETGDVVGVGIN